jgi:hypothetical protein
LILLLLLLLLALQGNRRTHGGTVVLTWLIQDS